MAGSTGILSGGILGGIHWHPLWRDTGRDPLASDTGRDPLASFLAGYWAGSTGILSGGILGGIHWHPLWRDTGRDPLASSLAGYWAGSTGILSGFLAGYWAGSTGILSGGILGGIHWHPLWRDTGRDPLASSLAGSSLAGGCGVAASQAWILLQI